MLKAELHLKNTFFSLKSTVGLGVLVEAVGIGFVSSRDYLVFLIPGVKKFSRRKLVKGNHYFDSVSDVLSKVVSEPNLLELEVEEAKAGGCTEEDGLFPENAPSDKDDQFDSHRPCYLKPRVSTFNTDDMKFTVVDTSLVYRGKSSGLRELKYLPLGFNITSKKINQMTSGNTVSKNEVCNAGKTHKGDKHLGEANHKKGVSDNNSNKLSKCTVVDTSLVHRGKLSSKVKKRLLCIENREKNCNADCHKSTMDVDATINKRRTYDKADKIVERQRNPKTFKSDAKLLKKIMKQQSGPTARSGQSNNAAPPIKRRRLTACAMAETSRILEISSGDLGSEKPAFSRSSSFPEANKKSGNQVSHKQNVCFVASPAEEVVEDDKKGSFSLKIVLAGPCLANPDMNQRRHSTRNRPLTVRALESIESDFMIFVERQPKKKEDQAPKDPFNPCRRARTRVKATTHRHSSGGGSAISMEDRHLNGDSNVNQDVNKALD
ncbi:putative homeodomain transcription factor superfamily protein [Senna tora]|uniref:Putative homeodomain transcription factor superfamily protein n=1 Tax=Senna tora TaxID=362788 RepID=A0A834WI52_9FABA|nr:putative homeodomain transcription factor superfamily protein [Senna tora]